MRHFEGCLIIFWKKIPFGASHKGEGCTLFRDQLHRLVRQPSDLLYPAELQHGPLDQRTCAQVPATGAASGSQLPCGTLVREMGRKMAEGSGRFQGLDGSHNRFLLLTFIWRYTARRAPSSRVPGREYWTPWGPFLRSFCSGHGWSEALFCREVGIVCMEVLGVLRWMPDSCFGAIGWLLKARSRIT